MPQHLAIWVETQDGAGTLQPVAAYNDTLVPLLQRDSTGDLMRVPGELPGIAWVAAIVDQTVQPRCRLVAPSLRETYKCTSLEIPRIGVAGEPMSPLPINDFRRDPIRLRPGELVGFDTVNNPAAATSVFVMAQFCSGPVAPVDPRGGRWARFTTAASAMTPGTFNNRALTPDEALLDGTYEVLGMRAMSTSLMAARLSFPGQVARPGIIGVDTRADWLDPIFEPGAQGVLGTFSSQVLPTVDFFPDAADNEVQVVDLYIRPTGARR